MQSKNQRLQKRQERRRGTRQDKWRATLRKLEIMFQAEAEAALLAEQDRAHMDNLCRWGCMSRRSSRSGRSRRIIRGRA